jgi:hypothetical protein
MWYQDTIDLFSERIYGPFDFVEDHQIQDEAWNVLLSQADTLQIYINNAIDQGETLRSNRQGRHGHQLLFLPCTKEKEDVEVFLRLISREHYLS